MQKTYSGKKKNTAKNPSLNYFGFTLMEVVVATSIFATTITLMLSLFNVTLRIQRRTEALRQVSQTVRNVSEFLVKEIRNGQVDYNVRDGQITVDPVDGAGTVCPPEPTLSGVNAGKTYYDATLDVPITDRIGLVNIEGERECIAYIFDTNTNRGKLVIKKENVEQEDLTPPNVNISYAKFYVRPLKDPYTDYPNQGSSLVEVQPMVTFLLIAQTTLPTGESRSITYQTSISTNIYNIPNQ